MPRAEATNRTLAVGLVDSIIGIGTGIPACVKQSSNSLRPLRSFCRHNPTFLPLRHSSLIDGCGQCFIVGIDDEYGQQFSGFALARIATYAVACPGRFVEAFASAIDLTGAVIYL
jgi:hypothetical protein